MVEEPVQLEKPEETADPPSSKTPHTVSPESQPDVHSTAPEDIPTNTPSEPNQPAAQEKKKPSRKKRTPEKADTKAADTPASETPDPVTDEGLQDQLNRPLSERELSKARDNKRKKMQSDIKASTPTGKKNVPTAESKALVPVQPEAKPDAENSRNSFSPRVRVKATDIQHERPPRSCREPVRLPASR